MKSKKKIKVTAGIRHGEDVNIESLPEGIEADIADMLGTGKAKIRITTMIDTDLLDELKRRANADGDGRYQTYLNQFLRVALLKKDENFDKSKIVEVIKGLVKPSALKRKGA